jgi:hypothetical protein
MKNIYFLFALSILFFSCEKDDYLIPNEEVPEWLKERISEDEATIKSDPKLMPNYGAWIRYEFQGAYYYEYDNYLSSLSRNPYSQEGVRVDLTIAAFTDYQTDKCCKKFVWKAPSYHKI